MLCARFPRTRSSTLRSSADRALPLLTPVAATVAETSEPHHACSAEWTDQVTYSGDQAHVGASNHGKRSHNFSLLWRCLFPRRQQTQNAGGRGELGGGGAREE